MKPWPVEGNDVGLKVTAQKLVRQRIWLEYHF